MAEPADHVAAMTDVSKSYGRRGVLDHFNLSVGRGEMVAVTGPSGSGKSAMLNILGMLEQPDAGTVEICGVRKPELRSRARRQLLRSKVAYLFQNFALIDEGTVRSNLTVPLSATGAARRGWKDAMRSARSISTLPWSSRSLRSQVVSSNAWRVPARCCVLLNCCWLMSRRAPWTPGTVTWCSACYRTGIKRGSPSSLSPTILRSSGYAGERFSSGKPRSDWVLGLLTSRLGDDDRCRILNAKRGCFT